MKIPASAIQTLPYSSTEREKFLEKRIQEIEEKFLKIQESLSISTKGKGRGKKSKAKVSEDVDISQQINEVNYYYA